MAMWSGLHHFLARLSAAYPHLPVVELCHVRTTPFEPLGHTFIHEFECLDCLLLLLAQKLLLVHFGALVHFEGTYMRGTVHYFTLPFTGVDCLSAYWMLATGTKGVGNLYPSRLSFRGHFEQCPNLDFLPSATDFRLFFVPTDEGTPLVVDVIRNRFP